MLENISNYLKQEDYRISILKEKLHIMNFKSVIDITETEALLKIDKYIVKIYGNNLKLLRLDKKELLLSGVVKKVEIDG